MPEIPEEFLRPGDPRLERIIEGYRPANQRRQNNGRGLTVQFTHRIFPHVVAAARERDISTSGFVVRSALAVACFDEGAIWEEFMAEEKAPARFRGKVGVRNRDYFAGAGAGPWRIREME